MRQYSEIWAKWDIHENRSSRNAEFVGKSRKEKMAFIRENNEKLAATGNPYRLVLREFTEYDDKDMIPEVKDYVHFRLDNNWEGEGRVTEVTATHASVKLTAHCKEYNPGDVLFIGFNEIYKIV